MANSLRHLPPQVSGLQHFHRLVFTATFRPTECPIGLALFLLRAALRGMGRHADLIPVLDASWDRGLVRSPVPYLKSLSMGPGTVDEVASPQRGVKVVYEGRWMGEPPRKRYLGAEQRRALRLLASSPFGASEATMIANGFKRRLLADLIRAGLATAQRETLKADRQRIGRVTITEAGRRVIED